MAGHVEVPPPARGRSRSGSGYALLAEERGEERNGDEPAPGGGCAAAKLTMASLDNTHLVAFVFAAVLAYLSVGVLYYTKLVQPVKYRFVDAAYFCVATITTVGYGDLNARYRGASDPSQMLFTSLFAFVGVGVVGGALGTVLAAVADAEARRARKAAHGALQLSEAQRKVSVSLATLAVLLAVGTAAFHKIEGQSFIRAFYWCAATLTTVGYGDVAPRTDGGKWFACVYLLAGTGMMAKTFGDVTALPLAMRRRSMEARILEQYGGRLDADELADIATDPLFGEVGLPREDAGSCSAAEFVLTMLLKLDKVQKDDVQRCLAVFHGLDADHSGRLDSRDVSDDADGRPGAASPVRDAASPARGAASPARDVLSPLREHSKTDADLL
ncbi:hypothetical protein M885DRAFT_504406 [Pelagophyceae sp. CCMP2097]|nr:hypothetical protein M885DRAFT_504406 [Pelagophyceae sp. CCMP2097]